MNKHAQKMFLMLAAWLVTACVPGQVVTSFDFNGQSFNPTPPLPDNVSATPISTAGGLKSSINNNQTLYLDAWNADYDTGRYASFTIWTSSAADVLSLSDLRFESSLANKNLSPKYIKVGLFVEFNDHTSAQFFSSDFTLLRNTSPVLQSWSFGDLNNVSQAEFRFYVWGDPDNNSRNNRELSLDNIRVLGSVGSITPVPEPYEYGLIAVTGLLCYAAFNRRQLKKA